MKSYFCYIVVALVLVIVQQTVVGYPLDNVNDCSLSPLNRPQRKADPNMALLMAFTSKNKSKIPLSNNKKSMTYMIGTSDSEESLQNKNKQNMKLIQSLIKNGHVEYLKMDQKTKRENNQDDHSNTSENDESIESIELMRSVKNTKKSCYKDVYTNVLEAFQMALKKEIAEYKKCLCKKNKTMTTTTVTTTSTTTPIPIEDFYNNGANNERHTDNDDDEMVIGRALENPSDVICMHKKYAIMLNKFLDAMHCGNDKTTTEAPVTKDIEINRKEGKRTQRNNEKFTQRSDIETTIANNNVEVKEKADKIRPTDAIFQLFKQLHEFETKAKQQQSSVSFVNDNKIQQRTDDTEESISASEISTSNEDPDDEVLNQRLLQQLKALFQEYELSQDNGNDKTFLQSNENTSASFIQKSTKKSARKTAVKEDSNESTEATVILKNHTNKTKSTQPKETLRSKSNSNSTTDNNNSKIHRRTSTNHKSSNDHREKLSLNVKIPKSSSILVKKIKWD